MLLPLRRAALGASLLAAACGDPVDPLAPRDVAGTYVLRSVDGGALPFVIATEPQERLVVSSVIELRGDGTGDVAHVERIGEVGYSAAIPITYEIDGARGFVVDLPCPPEALCMGPRQIVGRFRDDGLVLTRYWLDGHEWSFDRVYAVVAPATR